MTPRTRMTALVAAMVVTFSIVSAVPVEKSADAEKDMMSAKEFERLQLISELRIEEGEHASAERKLAKVNSFIEKGRMELKKLTEHSSKLKEKMKAQMKAPGVDRNELRNLKQALKGYEDTIKKFQNREKRAGEKKAALEKEVEKKVEKKAKREGKTVQKVTGPAKSAEDRADNEANDLGEGETKEAKSKKDMPARGEESRAEFKGLLERRSKLNEKKKALMKAPGVDKNEMRRVDETLKLYDSQIKKREAREKLASKTKPVVEKKFSEEQSGGGASPEEAADEEGETKEMVIEGETMGDPEGADESEVEDEEEKDVEGTEEEGETMEPEQEENEAMEPEEEEESEATEPEQEENETTEPEQEGPVSIDDKLAKCNLDIEKYRDTLRDVTRRLADAIRRKSTMMEAAGIDRNAMKAMDQDLQALGSRAEEITKLVQALLKERKRLEEARLTE